MYNPGSYLSSVSYQNFHVFLGYVTGGKR